MLYDIASTKEVVDNLEEGNSRTAKANVSYRFLCESQVPRQPKGSTYLRTLLRQIKGLEGKGRRYAQSQKIVVVVVEVVVRLLNH